MKRVVIKHKIGRILLEISETNLTQHYGTRFGYNMIIVEKNKRAISASLYVKLNEIHAEFQGLLHRHTRVLKVGPLPSSTAMRTYHHHDLILQPVFL